MISNQQVNQSAMIPNYLKQKISFYYLSEKINPSTRLKDIPSIFHQNLDPHLSNLKDRLESQRIKGRRTFIDQHRCMVCDCYQHNEDNLESRTNFYPLQMSFREHLIFCNKCYDIGEYSYLSNYIKNNVLIQDDGTLWSPFPPDESIIREINLIDEESNQPVSPCALYFVPFYHTFTDRPHSEIYFMSFCSINGQGMMISLHLEKILTDNPNFCKYLKEHPEKLDFIPHLFFPHDLNIKIQEYLQEIKNKILSS